jgi:ElaB/YqjD/DUF883 family membrane-anchored ribosome-binding protein
VSTAMSQQGDALKDEMDDVAQTAKQRAVEVGETAKTTVEQQVDRRRSELGTGARRVAESTRQTGQELRDEGNDLSALLIDRASTALQRSAEYLERTDAEEMWRDVRDLGRRKPWLFVAAGAAVGVAAARMLKAAGQDGWSGYGPSSGSTATGDDPRMRSAGPASTSTLTRIPEASPTESTIGRTAAGGAGVERS